MRRVRAPSAHGGGARSDVFYFGEDVDTYKGGKVSGHEGVWHHGAAGATFGLMMPGTPTVGSRYYQEQAPGVAMDRAEIVGMDDRATTPAGTFERCLRTKETTPLEAFVKEYKLYAPGVGLIRHHRAAQSFERRRFHR